MYSVLGFADGAFQSDDDASRLLVQNITDCRVNLMRMMKNTTSLKKASIDGGNVDLKVYFSTRLLKQFYPFSFHCYFATTESINAASEFRFDSWDIMMETIYETREITDEIRRIVYTFTTRLDELKHFSDDQNFGVPVTLYNADFYVLARSLGRIFKALGTNNPGLDHI